MALYDIVDKNLQFFRKYVLKNVETLCKKRIPTSFQYTVLKHPIEQLDREMIEQVDFRAIEENQELYRKLAEIEITKVEEQNIYCKLIQAGLSFDFIHRNEAAYERYQLLVSAIYLSLLLSKRIRMYPLKEEKYEDALRRVIRKDPIVSPSLEVSLEENREVLEQYYISVKKNEKAFIKKYRDASFYLKKQPIFTFDNKLAFYQSYLCHNLDFSKERATEVDKILGGRKIVEKFFEIHLELVSFEILMSLAKPFHDCYFIEVPLHYFRTKTNQRSFLKLVRALELKRRLYFKIHVEDYRLYREVIEQWKETGVQICLIQGEKEISSRDFYQIPYLFIPYEESLEFDKKIKNAKQYKVKVIVEGLTVEKEILECREKECEYYSMR